MINSILFTIQVDWFFIFIMSRGITKQAEQTLKILSLEGIEPQKL
jgi:hypothetical protein